MTGYMPEEKIVVVLGPEINIHNEYQAGRIFHVLGDKGRVHLEDDGSLVVRHLDVSGRPGEPRIARHAVTTYAPGKWTSYTIIEPQHATLLPIDLDEAFPGRRGARSSPPRNFPLT